MSTSNTLPIGETVHNYETQLKELLSAQYVDQSILLGLINLMQSKLILEILNLVKVEELTEAHIDETITQVTSMWNKLQYKVVNFFKLQHKILFVEVSEQMLKSKKSNQDENSKVKLNSVEMRKLNDNYLKFNSQVNHFYYKVMNFFVANFKLSKLPPKLIAQFARKSEVELEEPEPKLVSSPVQWKIVIILHQCLLSLGNLSRTRTFIELNYLKPSLSVRSYYAHQKDTAKKAKRLEAYSKAFEYYKICILLDPNLNEPYNHIGMIYNSNDDYYNACYWFVRSQSTFKTTFQVGLNNLQSVMKKDEFKSAVISRRDDIDVAFMCLIGYYYLPEIYSEKSNPRNVTKSLRYADLELRFWLLIEKLDLSKIFNTTNATDNIIIKQLVLLISFKKLINKDAYDNFIIRYLSKVMTMLERETNSDESVKQCTLVCLRFIFSIFREIKELRNKTDMRSIQSLVNKLLQEQPKFDLSNKPTRAILFEEDINFKGLSIKEYSKKRDLKDIDSYAFNDFQDTELLKTENKGVLYGYFSDSINGAGIPDFIEDTPDSSDNDDTIDKKVIQYENNLRERSLIILGKKLLDISKHFKFDADENKFTIVTTTKIKDEQIPQKRSDNRKVESKTKLLNSEKKGSKSSQHLKAKENSSLENNQNKMNSRSKGENKNIRDNSAHDDTNTQATKQINDLLGSVDRKSGSPDFKSKIMTMSELEELVSKSGKTNSVSRSKSSSGSNDKKDVSPTGIPDSLEEIESFILKHTSVLHRVTNSDESANKQEHYQDSKQESHNEKTFEKVHNVKLGDPSQKASEPINNVERDEGLQTMVNSLVLENTSPQKRDQVTGNAPQFHQGSMPVSSVPFQQQQQQHQQPQQQLPMQYPQYTQGFGQQLPFNYGPVPNGMNSYAPQPLIQPFQGYPMYGSNNQFAAPPMFGNGSAHHMPQPPVQQPMHPLVQQPVPHTQHLVQQPFQQPIQQHQFQQQIQQQQPLPQPLHQQQPMHQPVPPIAPTTAKPSTGFSKQYYYNVQKTGYQ
ncbi:hypothetical protein CLIB1423_03S06370 [[Candida] railenensis]|uniref:Uncharacterized protein n=1 Tax=[Candida] railenensis TaxID=45579 RepID=A0A9P0VXG4_9ASCO|nr:hypothetical protein CLIB1423_03S06370 [[Candida] railenensis]